MPGEAGSAQAQHAAASVRRIASGLGAGASIRASQVSDIPITLWHTDDGRQVLECQSSGSSGAPKTIQRTPESWMASFEITRAQFGVGPDKPYAVLGVPGHSLVLFAILEALHLGADLSVLTGLSPRTQIAEMGKDAVQVLYATPAQLRLLVKVGSAPLSQMRLVFSGGGKLDQDTAEAVQRLFPNAKLHEFFGASETSFMTMAEVNAPITSVGKAYPGVEIALRDDDGQLTKTRPGELWVKSPYLFEGYVDGDNSDTRWQGGFLSVGEMAQMDADGFLYLLGRKSRMITVADNNVFPELVEAEVSRITNGARCAVIPLPDTLRGNVLVAVVEGESSPKLTQAITAGCRAQFGPHSTPKQVIYLDELPLLPAGKPDLVRLQHMVIKTT
ncbi:AMP-binding protein [Aliiroseovarius sp. F20344]|uniref:AMP-binding protein n=1 Tax=Aliiroseovarius sp. F20344 TaxID=2926414 RepID=UPI001FF3F421|nr:AMP-binding protein [Aliiroseovarius sp. F20344]MCK0142863.1 AMP-binding protein [Aliiroseovarius sp. F20344]